MKHPFETNTNAKLYLKERLSEAEDFRQVTKFNAKRGNGGLFDSLRKVLPVSKRKATGGTVQTQAS